MVVDFFHQQSLRQASLQAANDQISNAISDLPILSYYSFDLGVLYGSVDCQKFSVERPIVKARYSRKYFGRGKGVVAYTMLFTALGGASPIGMKRLKDLHCADDPALYENCLVLPVAHLERQAIID
jgi:Tn3 transposase DDE domain